MVSGKFWKSSRSLGEAVEAYLHRVMYIRCLSKFQEDLLFHPRVGDKSPCRLLPRIAPESRQGLLSPTLDLSVILIQVRSVKFSSDKGNSADPGLGATSVNLCTKFHLSQSTPRRKKKLVHCEMANRGYDVVVDVDEGVEPILQIELQLIYAKLTQGDLGHTDLQQDDLEFHSSSRLPEFL